MLQLTTARLCVGHGSQVSDSAKNRHAALRVTSGPDARITGTTPHSRHAISPTESTYLSLPLTISGDRTTRAAQTNPRVRSIHWVAVKGSHRFSLIWPDMLRTALAGPAPLGHAWASQRSAIIASMTVRSVQAGDGAAWPVRAAGLRRLEANTVTLWALRPPLHRPGRPCACRSR